MQTITPDPGLDYQQYAYYAEQMEVQRDLEWVVKKCVPVLTPDELALLRWSCGLTGAKSWPK